MSDPDRNKQTVARLFDAFRAGDVDARAAIPVGEALHGARVPGGLRGIDSGFAGCNSAATAGVTLASCVSRSLGI